MGVEVEVPTVTIEIEMPAGTVWNPGLVMSLDGTCNSSAFSIKYQQNPPLSFTLPVETCLFKGGECEQSATDKSRITYHFVAGQISTPPGVVEEHWNAYNIWTRPTIPMRYCVVPRKQKLADGTVKIIRLEVSHAYPLGNFSLLGITP